MFSVDCVSLSEFEDYPNLFKALAEAGVPIASEPPAARPSFQFGYREVGLDTLKRVLGYAGIVDTNTPLGVAGLFDPVAEEGEWVIFPLAGLRKHIEHTSGAAYEEFSRFRSLASFECARGTGITPADQIVIAVLECLEFCERNRLILAFGW